MFKTNPVVVTSTIHVEYGIPLAFSMETITVGADGNSLLKDILCVVCAPVCVEDVVPDSMIGCAFILLVAISIWR